jgi:hypothetical protein
VWECVLRSWRLVTLSQLGAPLTTATVGGVRFWPYLMSVTRELKSYEFRNFPVGSKVKLICTRLYNVPRPSVTSDRSGGHVQRADADAKPAPSARAQARRRRGCWLLLFDSRPNSMERLFTHRNGNIHTTMPSLVLSSCLWTHHLCKASCVLEWLWWSNRKHTRGPVK